MQKYLMERDKATHEDLEELKRLCKQLVHNDPAMLEKLNVKDHEIEETMYVMQRVCRNDRFGITILAKFLRRNSDVPPKEVPRESCLPGASELFSDQAEK